jgi:hypothetical protein
LKNTCKLVGLILIEGPHEEWWAARLRWLRGHHLALAPTEAVYWSKPKWTWSQWSAAAKPFGLSGPSGSKQ